MSAQDQVFQLLDQAVRQTINQGNRSLATMGQHAYPILFEKINQNPALVQQIMQDQDLFQQLQLKGFQCQSKRTNHLFSHEEKETL